MTPHEETAAARLDLVSALRRAVDLLERMDAAHVIAPDAPDDDEYDAVLAEARAALARASA